MGQLEFTHSRLKDELWASAHLSAEDGGVAFHDCWVLISGYMVTVNSESKWTMSPSFTPCLNQLITLGRQSTVFHIFTTKHTLCLLHAMNIIQSNKNHSFSLTFWCIVRTKITCFGDKWLKKHHHLAMTYHRNDCVFDWGGENMGHGSIIK